MVHGAKERWLLLDDKRTDRLRVEYALAASVEVDLVPAATAKEVFEILETDHVSLCLLDFYLAKGTSEALIAHIRNRFPHMPIIVVSGEAGKDGPIYRAGADAVVPKSSDMSAFALGLQNAIHHARSMRDFDRLRIRWHQPWLGDGLKIEFKKTALRVSGNVLIVSAPGMGRTSLARALANRIRIAQPDLYGRHVRSIACCALDPTDAAAFDKALFGAPAAKEGTLIHRGLLVGAEGAVLVVDDAHLLPESVQRRLKALFERGSITGNSGHRIDASRLRIIFTTLSDTEKSGAFVSGFLQTAIASRIRLPTFALLARQKRKILSFWLKRKATGGEKIRVRADAEFVRELFAAVERAPHRVSMRSFAKTVEEAIAHAVQANRLILDASDLGDMPFLYESANSPATDEREAALRELIDAATTGTLDIATIVLRKFMIERALLSANGNKARAATKLGIARQTLYREAFALEPASAL